MIIRKIIDTIRPIDLSPTIIGFATKVPEEDRTFFFWNTLARAVDFFETSLHCFRFGLMIFHFFAYALYFFLSASYPQQSIYSDKSRWAKSIRASSATMTDFYNLYEDDRPQ